MLSKCKKKKITGHFRIILKYSEFTVDKVIPVIQGSNKRLNTLGRKHPL